MDFDLQELVAMAEAKVTRGKQLIKELCRIEGVDGVKKVQRKINQEINCLSNKVADQSIQMNNIICSNLLHFESLVRILLECEGLVYVDYAVPRANRSSPLRIDAVCNNGATWVKVIARNSRSIEDAVHGRTNFGGAKSVVETALEYVEESQKLAHQHMFKSPQIVFVFHSAITEELTTLLTDTGIIVCALDDFLEVTRGNRDQAHSQMVDLKGVDTLNLDITTLLAYVSALTNPEEGQRHIWDFREPLLTQQSKWEVQNPVKPILDSTFEGRKLICCETARESFMDIISLLGGENEKRRANELLVRVEVLPDVSPEEELQLNVGGRIKQRSLKIFAFGMKHRAVTVTSNEGFIRAARMQGVDVPVFIHEARALTEEKERNATKLPL